MIDTSDVDAFQSLISQSQKIVLTCHVRPDGDAIGSTLGLSLLLKRLGKECNVVVPDRPPRNLSFLPGFEDIVVFTQYDPYCGRLAREADLIICCDFNKASRQDLLASVIQGAECPKVMIDHHMDPDDFANVTFSYPDMSSTCELAVRIIAALGLFTEVDKNVATCLLTGIVTDTRNFSVNTKHADIYEILGILMERGADKEDIVKKALMTRSYWSLLIQAFAISERLEVFEKHHAAIISLGGKDLDRFHYERGDTEGLVNMPLEVRGMVSSFFLREDKDCIKISSRSCFGFPVSKICEDLFGGGGHLQAAGGEFHGTLEECRKILVDALPKYDKYLPPHVEKIDMK
ncbi:MAG: DHH family phosphoesterase [Muribaculum sp.]|nr:DHH family phosphoesterase [Muribaculum sp.]